MDETLLQRKLKDMMNELGYILPVGQGSHNPQVSWYYKYNFISPESIYAEIKEELKSYFQTGVIDDALFPRYTEDCLRKLGKGSYKIEENIFRLEDFEAVLPENFLSVRELWLVTPQEYSYRMPNSCYEQATVRVDSPRDRCNPGDVCAPKEIKITYKTTGQIIQRFNCHYLLRPGNVHAKDYCSPESFNRFTDSASTFDIQGNKIVTNFPEGMLYMVYYSKVYDENDYQMIPENIYIEKYIKAYLKFKCFENIYNNISDETLNQVQVKMQYYEARFLEAQVDAQTEMKKQTIDQQIRGTKAARNRLRRFNIT